MKLFVLFFALGSCALVASSALPSQPTPSTGIVNPCNPVTDKCVRDNLAVNSRCRTKNLRGVPKSYKIDQFAFEAPFFNASYIDRDLVIQNQHQCHASTFFYNLDKDISVLSIDCPGLIISSNRTLIQHASYQEDKVYSFTSTWEYPLIRLTANINNADQTNICKTYVFGDVAVMPRFVLQPNDISTKNFLSSDLSFLNIYEREMCHYRAPQLFHTYVNGAICDFGC